VGTINPAAPRRDCMRAGIRDRGRPASVTRDVAPRLEVPYELMRRFALVVLVQGGELRRDPVMRQQPARVTRVLREDDVNGAERGDRALRDVAQITDRRGHHI
jgi:hypothetical protein